MWRIFIKVGQSVIALAINLPAPTSEKFIAEKGDFTYLPSLPGFKCDVDAHQNGPMQFIFPGSEEMQIVSKGSWAASRL